MKFIVCVILMGLSLVCCKCKTEKQVIGNSLNDVSRLEFKKENVSALIKSKWFLNRWVVYHTLDFSDKTVFVDNHVDTVFTLNYSVENDTLITWSTDSDKKYKNQIINLTKDTFVIKGFNGSTDTLNYSGIKSEWKN